VKTTLLTSSQYRAAAMPRAKKYRNVPTVVDGIRFDSKAEAARWTTLKLCDRAGIISNLCRQPRYTLSDAYTDRDGKKHRAVVYVADFSYTKDGETIVEDVKGVETAVFRLKARLFREKYPNLKLVVVR
jgi:hypothetical protein